MFLVGVILATVYANKHTHEAYRLIFKLFFETVEAVTGRPLRFHQLDPINGTLRGILLDGEPAQFQGLGLYLMEVVRNHPSKRYLDISDPGQLALHFGRTCKVHFQRYVDDLPITLPLIVCLIETLLIHLESTLRPKRRNNF